MIEMEKVEFVFEGVRCGGGYCGKGKRCEKVGFRVQAGRFYEGSEWVMTMRLFCESDIRDNQRTICS